MRRATPAATERETRFPMSRTDATFEIMARRAIIAHLQRKRWSAGRQRVYLVSYPRSGSTLVREFFSILQGRPQYSVYDDDVLGATALPLTNALDHLALVKSHQFPADDEPMVYLVRDGRNATLSFLYLTFLSGGHRFSHLAEAYDGVRYLDRAEGSWPDHVAEALRQSERRRMLFVRYEDLVCSPGAVLARMARFMGAGPPAEVIEECLRRQKRSDSYARNPYSGYLYEPEKNSIYDVLKRYRRADYWRYIFDGRSKRHFHESGGTEFLLRFGYAASADWWRE